MTHPHRDQPSLHECQTKLRELAGTVGQGVLELRKARENWANTIFKHEKALAERERDLSKAIETARAKAKAVPREDGKRQTQEDINAMVKAETADEAYDAAIEEAVVRHAKRMEAAEIKSLEGDNDARASDRAIWKALLESVMNEMHLAGTPPPNRYGRTG